MLIHGNKYWCCRASVELDNYDVHGNSGPTWPWQGILLHGVVYGVVYHLHHFNSETGVVYHLHRFNSETGEIDFDTNAYAQVSGNELFDTEKECLVQFIWCLESKKRRLQNEIDELDTECQKAIDRIKELE